MSKNEVRKRNNRVQVRLDSKEYQAFMKAVRKSGLSQEVYLRHLINGVVPQDAPPSRLLCHDAAALPYRQ